MNAQTVGVIGAGVMGVGLAQNLADSDHSVILLDISDQVLDRARGQIKQGLRLSRLLRRGETKTNSEEAWRRILFTTDAALLREADFVIENVTEKWDVKKEVYQRVDAICPAHTILAANTSAIPITMIASATQRPDKVVGMHFMNPVPLKNTVEVIRGHHTSEATLEAAKCLLSRMGKEWVVVKDSPGFVSNRVLMLSINEAIFLVYEQIASPGEIDRIFTDCLGHKMGPLATADLIGLDTILFSIEVLYENFNDSKYRPCPLLREMVAAGLYGCKSGRGFFDYEQAV
jgi:3-hydroxybutyryl-CoA dehydrogenase